MERFGKLTHEERSLLHCALFVAIEQWEKNAQANPGRLSQAFEKQIETGGKLQEELMDF